MIVVGLIRKPFRTLVDISRRLERLRYAGGIQESFISLVRPIASTLIRHMNGALRKRSSKPRNLNYPQTQIKNVDRQTAEPLFNHSKRLTLNSL